MVDGSGAVTIFDPYTSNQPTHPGLNTGGPTDVSTMAPVPTDGPAPGHYRSGLLSALAPFLGWVSVVLATAMGLAAGVARLMCGEGRLDAPACTTEPAQLVLAPAAVLLVGVVLAAIAGSLAKRRRALGSVVALAIGVAVVYLVLDWFRGTLLGLPFP